MSKQTSSQRAPYINIVKELKNKNTEFHTYKPKQETSFKVVLQHIHATADLDDIKKEIEDLGQLPIYGTSRSRALKGLFICST